MKWILTFFLAIENIFAGTPVLIEYFFQPGCEECVKVSTLVLPVLEEHFSKQYVLRKYDINEEHNYLRLVAYQEQLQVDTNDSVCMIVGTRYLGGFQDIDHNLLNVVELELKKQPSAEEKQHLADGREALYRRAYSFTVGTVAIAGLLDGFNPCVFSTLVFFLSLLGVNKIRGRKLFIIGLTYCLASFLTYVALGLGILRFLLLFSGYPVLKVSFEAILSGFLLIFAVLSFRDAWKFWKTGKSQHITLQLPGRIKDQIHAVMRAGLKMSHLLVGAFCIGAIVTVLESVCSGQVYVPTLALMARETGLNSRWFLLLLLYNVMFILPLLFLFFAAWRGTTLTVFLDWSRRNVVKAKIALGIFFLLMAAIILIN